MDKLRDLSRRAYDAYAEHAGGQTFDGRPMPTFEQLVEAQSPVVDHWDAAVLAVVDAVRSDTSIIW